MSNLRIEVYDLVTIHSQAGQTTLKVASPDLVTTIAVTSTPTASGSQPSVYVQGTPKQIVLIADTDPVYVDIGVSPDPTQPNAVLVLPHAPVSLSLATTGKIGAVLATNYVGANTSTLVTNFPAKFDAVVGAVSTDRGGATILKASAMAITAGGSGYAVGNTITNAAGVFTVSTVSSGAVTAVALTTPAGLTASTSGALAQTATSGTGTGCTMTPTYALAALQIAPANASRRGFTIQNQSNGIIWFSTLAAATPDQHSFQMQPGDYFESSPQHVGTGAISVIGSSANQLFYAREF